MFFDCNSDISAHLTSCHFSKCGDVTEGPHVLARAGISHLSAAQVAGMTICSRPEVLPIPWSYWESCKCGGKTRSKLSKWTTKYAFCLAKAPLSDHGSTIFPFFFLPPFHTVIYPVKVGGEGGATPIWVFDQSTVFLIDAIIDRVSTVNQELFSPAFSTHPTAVLPRIRKKVISICSTICLFFFKNPYHKQGQDLAAGATHSISDFGCVGVSPLPAVVLFFSSVIFRFHGNRVGFQPISAIIQ